MPLLSQKLPEPPKTGKWVIYRMVYAPGYVQGILYADGSFVCYTHEYPEGKKIPLSSGQCIPNRKTGISYKPSTYRWGTFKGPTKHYFMFCDDPDNLNFRDIAVGMKCTPHGGLIMGNEAMARLRALSHGYTTASLSFIELRDTPPDWMEPWLTRAW